MNKLKIALYSAGATVLSGLGLISTAHAQVISTSTVATGIDSVSSAWYDLFLVFVAHAWPFILGAGVLVGIVALAIGLVAGLFHMRRRR